MKGKQPDGAKKVEAKPAEQDLMGEGAETCDGPDAGQSSDSHGK